LVYVYSIVFGYQDSDFHNYGQWMVVTECIYRTMYRTRYLAMFDVDELIVPLRTDSWAKMMETFPTKEAQVAYVNSCFVLAFCLYSLWRKILFLKHTIVGLYCWLF